MIQRTQGNTQRIAIAVEKAELNKEGEIIRTPFEFEAGDRVAVTLYGKRKYIYTPELATGVAVVTLIGTEICDVYDMRVDITRADGTRNAYNSRAVLELVPEQVPEVGVIDTSVFLFAKGETAIIDDMDGDAPDFAPSQRAVKEYLNDNVAFLDKPAQALEERDIYTGGLSLTNSLVFYEIAPHDDLNSLLGLNVKEKTEHNDDPVCRLYILGENYPSIPVVETRPYDEADAVNYMQLLQLSNALDTTFYRDYYGNIKAKSGHGSGQFTSDEKGRVSEVISIGVGRTTLENFLTRTSNDGILTKIWTNYLDLSKIKNMQSAFRGQVLLKSLYLHDVSESLDNISYIAMNCKKMNYFQIIAKDANIHKCANAFNGCEDLERVYLSGLDFWNVEDASFMFKGCKKLNIIRSLTNLRVSLDISETQISGSTLNELCWDLGEPDMHGSAILDLRRDQYNTLYPHTEYDLLELGWQINVIDDEN